MQKLVLYFLTFSIIFLFHSEIKSKQENNLEKPEFVPENAQYIKPSGWKLKFFNEKIFFWDKNGKVDGEVYYYKYKYFYRTNINYHNSGAIESFFMKCKRKHPEVKTEESEKYLCGKHSLYNKNEKLTDKYCYTYSLEDVKNHIYDRECVDGRRGCYEESIKRLGNGKIFQNVNCGENYFSWSGKTKYMGECEDECIEIYPYRQRGIYRVRVGVLNVREKHSSKAKKIFSVKKGDYVSLLSVTKEMEKVGDIYSVWAKIRTRNGKNGYVFAAFLNAAVLSFDEDDNLKLTNEMIDKINALYTR